MSHPHWGSASVLAGFLTERVGSCALQRAGVASTQDRNRGAAEGGAKAAAGNFPPHISVAYSENLGMARLGAYRRDRGDPLDHRSL